MKQLQKYSFSFEKGKLKESKTIEKPRSFMDTIADTLLEDCKKKIKDYEDKKTSGSFESYKFVKDVVKGFDIEKANKDDLINYAEKNAIEVDKKLKVAEIREIIKESI